uniref:protein NYNRIN-like n=1 Tax=Callithrix jacchus TaxID=9483 RepID=UPI0023DD186A|nr:protein NYNRIN-like [Callithrix jacchus]XP_054107125.1 protein NYNRIN-like [Callithrix jacchus]
MKPLTLIVTLPTPNLPPTPMYSPEEENFAKEQGGRQDSTGWWILPDTKIVLPEALGRALVKDIHQATHLGQMKLTELLRARYYIQHLYEIVKETSTHCDTCARVNPGANRASQVGIRLRGASAGEHWEVDFTEIKPPACGYKYLLVFVDTFSGWVEAFPTRLETALVVTKRLLQDLVPRFGLPLTLGSDNGPAFTAQVSQGLAKALGVSWKLHCAYRPQSSGQVERMNRSIKETLTKFILETGENWVNLLPFVLLRTRCTPYKKGFTPFEIMFGRPPPLLPKLADTVHAEVHNHTLLKSLHSSLFSPRCIHSSGKFNLLQGTSLTSRYTPSSPSSWEIRS